jgi:hypothetical protein
MGNLSPYWDRRLPISGVDAGFAGDRWDIVVKRFFSEVVETVLADSPHKPVVELVRPAFQPRCPISRASPGGNPVHRDAHAKGTLATVDTTRSIFASFNPRSLNP